MLKTMHLSFEHFDVISVVVDKSVDRGKLVVNMLQRLM